MLGASQENKPVVGNSRLTDAQREKLLNIKKREELKDVLIHKFKERYAASKESRGAQSEVISKEVAGMLDKGKLTAQNLGRLDRRIAQHVKRADGGPEEDALSHVSKVSSYSALSRHSRLSGARSDAGSVRSRRSVASHQSGKSSLGLDAMRRDHDWAKLDDYAAYLHEQDAARQRQCVVDMQHRLRSDLDRQILDQRLKKQRLRAEEQKYHANQVVELEQWREVEKERAEEARAKAEKERLDRDEQLRYDTQRKEQEAVQREDEEKALVTKIQRELELDRQRALAKREAQRQAMTRIREENMEERRLKAEARRQQAEADMEAMREYERILAEQEASRTAELEGRLARQKALMEKMKESVIKQQNEKSDEDARRAQKQKEEADLRAEEMERNKADRLAAMRLDTQAFLCAQMAEKDEKRRQAAELKRLQAHVLEADTRDFMAQEQDRMRERKSVHATHRHELEKQIAARRAEDKYKMSQSEVLINRQLLEVVDATLLERDAGATDGMEHAD